MPQKIRDQIADRLTAGATVKSVAAQFDVGRNPVVHIRNSLPPDKRHTRNLAISAKRAQKRCAQILRVTPNRHALKVDAVPPLAAISQAVPKGLDRGLRDDVIGQLYLDYLEGNFQLEDLPKAVKSAVAAAYRDFASSWGNLSLDEVRLPDGRPMIENVTRSLWD